MPSYVLLLRYTDQGMQNIKYLSEHISAFRQTVEGAGGKVPKVYLTMGQYDVVAIVEAPSDQACVSMALSLISLGNIRSTTLKAFAEDEFGTVVGEIPSLEEEFSRILGQFEST